MRPRLAANWQLLRLSYEMVVGKYHANQHAELLATIGKDATPEDIEAAKEAGAALVIGAPHPLSHSCPHPCTRHCSLFIIGSTHSLARDRSRSMLLFRLSRSDTPPFSPCPH